MKIKTLQIHIPDIHCAGCTQRISNVVERMSGVRAANVSLNDKQAEIIFDEDVISLNEIENTVEKIGYSVEHEE